MNIKIDNINFKSNITKDLLIQEKRVKPRQVLKYLKNYPKKDWGDFVQSDFKENKTIALISKLCINIFRNFQKKYDYRKGYSFQNLVCPQDIYVFDREIDKSFKDFPVSFFTNFSSISINDNSKHFQKATVFLDNNISSLEELNSAIEKYYKDRLISSNHFLQPFVHEWIHSIFFKFINNITKKSGASYSRTIENFENKKLTNKEKEIVFDIVGEYPILSTNPYSELLAEAGAKFICDSLAEDCKSFKNNPIDLYKSTPNEFQKIMKKVLAVEIISK